MRQPPTYLGCRQPAEWCEQHHIAWVQAQLLRGARLVLLNSCAIGIELYDLHGTAMNDVSYPLCMGAGSDCTIVFRMGQPVTQHVWDDLKGGGAATPLAPPVSMLGTATSLHGCVKRNAACCCVLSRVCGCAQLDTHCRQHPPLVARTDALDRDLPDSSSSQNSGVWCQQLA
jgi:hypothetical protein